MQIVKQSTVATIYVGPVLDSAGIAVTTAVRADFRIVKNGTAATLTGATVAHDANGYYTIELTTANTDTLGRLTLAVGNTAMSMATHRYTVLIASVFDALMTATNTLGGLATATGGITALQGSIFNGQALDAAGTRAALGMATANLDNQISTIADGISAILGRIPSTLFAGMTSLARWLGLMSGKTSDTTTLAEMQATTAGATFANATDSLEALRDRGDAAWVTGGGSGQYSVAVTVRDSVTNLPLKNAVVTVFQASTQVAWSPSNASGIANLALDAATYNLVVSCTGYAASTTNALVVSGNATATITLTAQSIAAPPSGDYCTVAISVIRGAAVVPNAEITITMEDLTSTFTPGAEATTVVTVTADGNGAATFALLKTASKVFGDGVYRIKIRDPRDGQICHDRRFTVPNQSTANYYQLPNVV